MTEAGSSSGNRQAREKEQGFVHCRETWLMPSHMLSRAWRDVFVLFDNLLWTPTSNKPHQNTLISIYIISKSYQYTYTSAETLPTISSRSICELQTSARRAHDLNSRSLEASLPRRWARRSHETFGCLRNWRTARKVSEQVL